MTNTKAKKSLALDNQAVRIYSFSRVGAPCNQLLMFRALCELWQYARAVRFSYATCEA